MAQQLCGMRQQKRQHLRDMKKESEQQLHDMKKQTEQQLHDTVQQLHDTVQQKEQIEHQLHDTRQLMEQKEQQLKEQTDASEKRLRTTEVKFIEMQLKYKSLKRELHEMVQKADASQITQTTNFMDYNQQTDASEKKLRTTEVKFIEMQLKYKSLKREIHEMVQNPDASLTTQTTNFKDYNPMNASIKQIEQLSDMRKESEQQLHDMKKQTEQQLQDMRHQKEQTEQQLHDIRQQKEQTEQQLHDTRQQKKQIEQQLYDMRQWMEQKEQQLKEQTDASEKRLHTTEVKLTKMQLKNKSLRRELHEMVQKADASQITQTTNFMDYNPMNSSISRNSSGDEEEHL